MLNKFLNAENIDNTDNIINGMDKNKIEYKSEYIFENLPKKRFDFYIDSNYDLYLLTEQDVLNVSL